MSEKRKISVGFIKPGEFEGDTIYVQLKQFPEWENKTHKGIYAEAISDKEFRYITFSMIGDKLEEKGKRADSLLGDTTFRDNVPRDYISFLSMLQRENDAEVINSDELEGRVFEDGLKLAKQLESDKRSIIKIAREINGYCNNREIKI